MDKNIAEAVSEKQRKKLYKRTLIVVCIAQIFGGAGLAAGITVGALLARDMLGTDAYAGLPTALFTLGSALSAFAIGMLTQRLGRRRGLVAGFMVGGIGAAGVVFAALISNITLLLISLFVYGAGTATNLQARYAGTDLATDKQRATAVSVAMVATTLGAVAGPNLVGVMGQFALSIGVPALAGPFILAGGAFITAGIILFFFLRPDPLLIVKRWEAVQPRIEEALKSETKKRSKGVAIGVIVMVTTQLVMVAIMTMTPVHMEHHGHSINAIGLVIGIHVCAMYLPSLFTGVLADRFGRKAIVFAAGFTLLLAGCVGALAPGDSMVFMIIALALLGLGWNFGLISGTALIIDSTHSSTRAKTQGTTDVFIALAGATGGAMSGMVAAGSSYAVLSLTGGVFALLLVPIVFIVNRKKES